MNFVLDNKVYRVEIIRKNNKNTYIRVNGDIIRVTTNYFVTNSKVKKILDANTDFILKASKKVKKEGFYIMGNKLDVIYDINCKKTIVDGDKIFTRNDKTLMKFQEKTVKEIFAKRLEINYNKFTQEIPYPILKIRKMKSRWGVCNKVKQTVTLNYNLINYDYDCLDYVIVHELAHFVYFNHSKDFWGVVKFYIPNYKIIKKKLLN